MALSDTIKEWIMNESAGVETPAAPASPPAATTPPPATPTEPATPAATPPAEPTAEQLADPEFVKNMTKPAGKEPAPGAPPAAPAGPAGEGTPPASPAGEPSDPTLQVFNSRLSELTDGHIKTEEDLGAFFENYNNLVDQAEKGFQPQFKDERAKLVYQLLAENPGNETGAAMRVLRALDFNPEGKTPKDVLFEGYLLDPKNSDLTPLKAQEYFEIEYQNKYQDLETNPLRKRELDLAVRDANKMIGDIQSSFKATEEQPRQISGEVEQGVLSAVDGFGGVRLSFSDNPAENEFLNIAVDDSKELASIQREMLDPASAHNEFLSQFDFSTAKGYADCAREIYERSHHRELRQAAYDHGFKLGQLAKVNAIRNASNPKDISRVATPPGAGPKKGLFETWGEAAGKNV